MKASELIKRLEALIKEHGDLECETSEYGIVDQVTRETHVELVYSEGKGIRRIVGVKDAEHYFYIV